jgi:hypothetical protein
MISKRAHRIFDYIYGVALLASPYLFGMNHISNVKEVFFWAGLVAFANVFVSRYSIKIHMKIDLLIGAFIILAPLLFSYKRMLSSAQYEVHIVAGFLFILLVGETRYRHEDSIAGSKISLEVGHFLSKSG